MGFEGKKLKSGTVLPILSLKGKPYLQVAHRLVWFREENPGGAIKTQMLNLQDGSCLFRAEIYMNDKEGKLTLVASGHKNETESNFSDYIEKAETGAIGRALAMAGYGTQFEPEFDEGPRLADSPIDIPTKEVASTASGTTTANNTVTSETKVVRPTFKKKAAKTEESGDKI